MKTLEEYERAAGDETYRLHIPRALFAIYGLRNKRGYGHLSLDLAKKVDVTFMVETSRWVLAEILRIESDVDETSTDTLVEEIVERRLPLIWRIGDVERVLKVGLSLREQVLVLLFQNKRVTLQELQRGTEAKTPYLKRTLRALHSKRHIEFDEESETCEISPSGSALAESMLKTT